MAGCKRCALKGGGGGGGRKREKEEKRKGKRRQKWGSKSFFLARLYKVQVELLYSLWRLRSRSRHTTFKFCLSPYLGNHSSESIYTWTIGTQ